MIPRVHKRGTRTIGLLYYLYGPGTHEEHTDPHLVAAWDSLAPDPGRDPDATYADLQQLLDQPVEAAGGRRGKPHVWHLSLRAAPEDPVLTDEQWGEIARRMVAATGIAPAGDNAGCRWAAVRHADDHIHIIATLAREDGRTPRLNNDAARGQAEARLIEAEYGLRRLNAGDGTAARRPTSAERHKATREKRERTPREELRETVRRAVAGTQDETEFFDRLAAAGLLVRQRVAPSGDLLGYTVALPDDRNGKGEPVFYSGSKLAPDLSLPRIRERWTTPDEPPVENTEEQPVGLRPVPVTGPAGARRRATEAVWRAVLVVDQGDDTAVAAQLAGAGEVLDALAKTSAAHTRQQLRDAAFAFERATRSHVRAAAGHGRALRRAARDLAYGGPALGRGEDGATTAMVIDMAVFLVTAAAHWHARRGHAQQAAAAREAATHLRAAYQQAAAHPIAALRERGRRLALPIQHRQAAVVRAALPQELADQVLGEAAWPALAATLADTQTSGHDPVRLLSQAAGHRELDTAECVTEVLVWRLRRMAGLPADTALPPAGAPAGPSPRGPAAMPAKPSDQPRRVR
ncbi:MULTISPECIES: relaxase/mobilization nuclease domain-containing protein [Streptomyces]|uniref:Mobilization protein n=1 Tax=Streptomyces tsukubensis (strain DSM 42081 / NBRC 108919 / NRRL 18488 / 9993) TaxID=1114943 RepID=I2N850_STRT9|nr:MULTISPECIES: relaxase/mobilization nuclease domain-containing protein [Streptomyces]AZK97080.1 mobilization protein [Streptomyces tsukubensis]EIF93197.1 Relaxase/mobilization nuclease family protein [Streptomyces tsukubensis NRRL18488]QKM66949.1 mobilization protein [Streptomyces tsukubensis NRRL18488]TAI41574.1 mobilization protein [Streptomyces tsukubensis]